MKKKIPRMLIAFLLIIITATTASAAQTLIPGGQIIGLQLQDGTVTVADFDEDLGKAAKNAGLARGDRLVSIDDTPIRTAQDVREALQCSDGRVTLRVNRDGKAKTLSLEPPVTDDGPRLGVYLRQGTGGMGTVTYYDPNTQRFGTLGHGVNDKSGNLLPMQTGSAYSASVYGVNKGKAGTPGQLLGSVTNPESLGKLEKNTNRGVFGKGELKLTDQPLPVAQPSEVRAGEATIRSTVDGNGLREYSVEILKIYPTGAERTRNMLLKVTDPDLLAATGGIVQGMSGSPIIQDGKLVGAVTHVLVNDPTTGYGIFIENMLDAAA